MIDFHNHILPNIDDGSKSLEMSINMLREAESQGIRDIVNTVHFQHPKMDGKDITFDIISEEVQKLNAILYEEGINVKIHIGSEIFFLPNLVELKHNPLCTMGDGKYMLIEFEPMNIPKISPQILFDLKMAGVVPIIAHPERYKEVQKDIYLINEWIQMGCLIQIDAGSIDGSLGRLSQITVNKIIQNRMFHLIGSDAHNDRKRNFCLKMALEQIAIKTDDSFAKQLIQNGYKVLHGKKIQSDFIEFELRKRNLFNKIKSKIWS
jgi:protein-tyrosine phosphatase